MIRKARDRGRGTHIGATAVVFVGLALSASAATEPLGPAPLPADPRVVFDSGVSALQLSRAIDAHLVDANSCSVVSGALECTCVVAPEWSADAIGAATHGYRAPQLHVGRLSGTSAADVSFLVGDRIINFAKLELRDGQVHGEDVRWFEATEQSFGLACGAEPHMGRPVAVAKSATLRDGTWSVEGYQVGPWPVAMANRADRLAPGLIPPLVRGSNGSLEGEALAHVGFGVLAAVSGGLDAPFAAGLGLVTRDAEDIRVLRALVAVESAEARPVLVGDFGLGELTHARGRVEHPMTDSLWDLRRREMGGFFRAYRATRVGAAVSGDAHAMQLAGEVVTIQGQPDEIWLGSLQYGTSFRTGIARWSADIEQVSDRRDAVRHSVLVGVGAAVPIGRPNAAWIEPSIDVVANYGAVTVSRGFDGSTSISALTQLEAGLAFEGRARDLRHRIAPIFRAGGELFGVQQRQAREGAPDYPYTRPTAWRYAGLFLEHTLVVGPATFELPIGVLVDAIGEETTADGLGSPSVFSRFDARVGPARADAAVVCGDTCEAAGYSIGASVRVGRMRFAYRTSELDARQTAALNADRELERSFSAIRLVQRFDDELGEPAHHARMTFTSSRVRVGAEGYRHQLDEASGAGIDAALIWPALGWGLGLGGAYAPVTRDWAASAGLRLGL